MTTIPVGKIDNMIGNVSYLPGDFYLTNILLKFDQIGIV